VVDTEQPGPVAASATAKARLGGSFGDVVERAAEQVQPFVDREPRGEVAVLLLGGEGVGEHRPEAPTGHQFEAARDAVGSHGTPRECRGQLGDGGVATPRREPQAIGAPLEVFVVAHGQGVRPTVTRRRAFERGTRRE
jgi:hypothetical protein